MIKRILVGLAGTNYTPTAIQRAVTLAREHSADVTGVTVVDRRRLRGRTVAWVNGPALKTRLLVTPEYRVVEGELQMIRWLKSLCDKLKPGESSSPNAEAGARGEQAAADFLQARHGLFLPLAAPCPREWLLLAASLAAALLLGLLPAWRAYRQSLVDGLSIRL